MYFFAKALQLKPTTALHKPMKSKTNNPPKINGVLILCLRRFLYKHIKSSIKTTYNQR